MAELHQRIEYETAGLDRDDLADDPVDQWWRWFRQAEAAGCTEPNAMTVSTVDADGFPDARVVLVRDVDETGFSFYTNYDSSKSEQLAGHPVAASTFAWLELHRQVRVRGTVTRVAEAASDAYFVSRPRGSQLGAWASPQSRPLPDRSALERSLVEAERRFAGREVTRPPHWGGWLVVPREIEFWQGRPSRLHDRFRYRRSADESGSGVTRWAITRLAP